MDEQQLYQQLEALKAELDASSNLSEETREKMLGLIGRMEEQMHTPDDAEDSLAEQFETLVAEFEVSHPTLTGIVNNLLVTLGSMGV
jgi:hypothetical protein